MLAGEAIPRCSPNTSELCPRLLSNLLSLSPGLSPLAGLRGSPGRLSSVVSWWSPGVVVVLGWSLEAPELHEHLGQHHAVDLG